jgi:hypothetical protein
VGGDWGGVLLMDIPRAFSFVYFSCFILLVAFALMFFHVRLNIVRSLISISDLQLIRHGASL